MAILTLSQLSGVLMDMWIKIISWINSAVPSYVWAVIILTVAIKLVMTPLDYFNKKISRKNAKMQKVLQPQLEKLKKQYGNDQALYNQKMTELYKANNYSVVGSCLFMIVNLVLTFIIFISLLNGLNEMASIRIKAQYSELKNTYEQALLVEADTEEEKIEYANGEVVIKYKEIKESWLWIQNIWKADTTTNSIPTYTEYVNLAKSVEREQDGKIVSVEIKKLTAEEQEALKEEYELIMTPLREKEGKANGYFILLVLVVGTAILSQYLSQRKLSDKKSKTEVSDPSTAAPTAGMNKMMMILMPVLFGSFAFSSNAVFAIYLVVSQLITIATTPLIDLIIDKTDGDDFEKKKASSTPVYSREKTIDKPKQRKTKNKKGENND